MRLLNKSHPSFLGSPQAEWSIKCYMPRWCKKQIQFTTSFVALNTLDDNIQFRSRDFNHTLDDYYGHRLRPKAVVFKIYVYGNKHLGAVVS